MACDSELALPPTTHDLPERERETRKVAWEINGFSLRVIWPANLACMNNVGMAWAHSGLCDRSPTPWSIEACLPCRDRVQSAERRCMHPFSIPFCLSSPCVINPPRVNLRCDKIHLAQARSDQIRGLDLFDSRFSREWLPLGRRRNQLMQALATASALSRSPTSDTSLLHVADACHA